MVVAGQTADRAGLREQQACAFGAVGASRNQGEPARPGVLCCKQNAPAPRSVASREEQVYPRINFGFIQKICARICLQ